jgi:hypothetical protein
MTWVHEDWGKVKGVFLVVAETTTFVLGLAKPLHFAVKIDRPLGVIWEGGVDAVVDVRWRRSLASLEAMM